jgi:sugar O-acyltransferase (sialic acid O-acetyltransferase NeuD family)
VDYKNLKSGDSVVLIGCGGFSIELYSLLNQLSINVIGYIGEQSQKDLFSSLRFLGDDSEIKYWLQYEMLVAIGEPKIRKKIFNLVEKNGGALATFIHPNSYISEMISISQGAIIYPNSTIHANVKIGKGVLINSNVTVGHETKIGEFVNLSPGSSIGGKVDIGSMTHIGIGATVIERVKLGKNVVVGAGSVVVKNCLNNGIYVGVPAKILVK